MIVNLYSLYDTKALLYLQPFTAVNHQVAKRVLQTGADEQSIIRQHPADFILYQVGTFDESNAVIAPLAQPINHGPLEPTA